MVVEASPSALLLIDSNGRIQLVNHNAEELFGYPREALLGQPIEVLIPERFRPAHPGRIAGFFGAPESRPMGAGRDLFGLRRDGEEVPVEIGLNPFVTSEGRFTLASVIDITERKRSERELYDRTEELLRSNQDLEQFAYAASHDLQEPLRAVSGCVQLLQQRYEEKLDGRANELIAMAVDGTARMQALIEDLLTYSRLGRGADQLRSVSCAEVLDVALKNLSVILQETNTEIIRTALPQVWGNPAQLVMLFQNLVGNAIKFRSKDAPPKVHVSVERQGAFWEISVADNGIGIEPQYFQRIFVIFQRLHSRREYPGTGIGLALCKRIVEHHGGKIQIESEAGQGTTVHFTLKGVSPSGQISGARSENR
jgi:PAS domain S-box-containing protein